MQIHHDMVALATLVTIRNGKTLAQYSAVQLCLSTRPWTRINETKGINSVNFPPSSSRNGRPILILE